MQNFVKTDSITRDSIRDSEVQDASQNTAAFELLPSGTYIIKDQVVDGWNVYLPREEGDDGECEFYGRTIQEAVRAALISWHSGE